MEESHEGIQFGVTRRAPSCTRWVHIRHARNLVVTLDIAELKNIGMSRLHHSSSPRRLPGVASSTERSQEDMRDTSLTRWHSLQLQGQAQAHGNEAVQCAAAAIPTRWSTPRGHTVMDRKRKRSSNNKMDRSTSTICDAVMPVHMAKPHPCEPQSEKLQRKSAVMSEQEQLAIEIRALQARAELLRLEAGLPTQAAIQMLEETRKRNFAMRKAVDANRQIVSQLQAMASQHLQQPPVNPLATFIHLPCDKIQRCALLQAMKGVKLRRAAEDGIARFHDLEDSLSYLREERFTTDDGTYHCNRFEVAVYPQFKTARQLYDAVVFWLHNLDISVTEMIDHVALREDEEDMGPTIWNQRMISISEDVGCTEELNIVGFAQYFESHDLTDGGPLGVIVQESVDVDDLHPYKPLERTRKDLQMYCLVSEYVDPVTKQRSVLLKSTIFNGQLAPKFPVEPHTIEKLHEYMSRWCTLANQYLSNFVVTS